jgi:molybdopterin-containing oxidoreductase family iron-sulfur binding subunit
MEQNEDQKSKRRKFLKYGLLAGGATLAGLGIRKELLADTIPATGSKVKVMTPDGKLVEVDSSHLNHGVADLAVNDREAREGIEGRKFVMVIDLGRCANARKCVDACQKMHHKRPPIEWIKVKRMQDAQDTSPYWMPQPCFHCDNPPCTKVCPVDATFKRKDGVVLIDNNRCIGCRFCMAACPYNARVFNWGEKWGEGSDTEPAGCATPGGNCSHNSIETSLQNKKGTVSKCDFCVDMARASRLPDCVTNCPNGTIFFGDANEDTVSNGEDTFRLSELIRDRAGYRYLEDLGTEPRVYYLPPVERNFPFEEDKEPHNTIE